MRAYWWLGFLSLVAAVIGFGMARKTRAGTRAIDMLMLKLPLFGSIVTRLAFARFGRSLGVVIRSGMPILDGLPVVANALGNSIIAEVIIAAKERIRQGRAISESLTTSPLVPRMVVQMIRVGEETGAMEAVLNKISDFYEQEVDYILKRFASIIEPVLIIVVGGVVALVAASVLLPIWSLIGGLQR
jgi:type IV pilus assembly protein PilC